MVNTVKTSHSGLDTDYRKNIWGVGLGCTRLLNKNTVFSCISTLGSFPSPQFYFSSGKCHPLPPLFLHRSFSARGPDRAGSWGGAHSLSPSGYHLEIPARHRVTGDHHPLMPRSRGRPRHTGVKNRERQMLNYLKLLKMF